MMTMEQYGYVVDAYEGMFDEPLLADGDYVTPLWESTAIAVECQGEDRTPEDENIEVAQRVAVMIFVQTYGLETMLRSRDIVAILAQG
jgi:hypothetical protein